MTILVHGVWFRGEWEPLRFVLAHVNPSREALSGMRQSCLRRRRRRPITLSRRDDGCDPETGGVRLCWPVEPFSNTRRLASNAAAPMRSPLSRSPRYRSRGRYGGETSAAAVTASAGAEMFCQRREKQLARS